MMMEFLVDIAVFRIVRTQLANLQHILKLDLVSSHLLRYIVGLIIKTSSSPDLMEKERTYLNKLNLILVSILKRWISPQFQFIRNLYTLGQKFFDFQPFWLSGSGRRIGRVSSRTSLGRQKPTSRYARTTWSFWSCSVRKSSTSALVRWLKQKQNTSRTQCVPSSQRYILALSLPWIEIDRVQVFTLCQFVMDNSNNAALVCDQPTSLNLMKRRQLKSL